MAFTTCATGSGSPPRHPWGAPRVLVGVAGGDLVDAGEEVVGELGEVEDIVVGVEPALAAWGLVEGVAHL